MTGLEESQDGETSDPTVVISVCVSQRVYSSRNSPSSSRATIDGRPLYSPSGTELQSRSGAELLSAVSALGSFLVETGFTLQSEKAEFSQRNRCPRVSGGTAMLAPSDTSRLCIQQTGILLGSSTSCGRQMALFPVPSISSADSGQPPLVRAHMSRVLKLNSQQYFYK